MTGKPRPTPTSETLSYWQGGADGELRFSWCAPCARAIFPPRAMCNCGQPTEWRVSAGTGRIHSFTIVERAPLASFRDDVPYGIALVDLVEGFRIMVNVRGGTPSIGARVSIAFDPLGDGLFLPQAELATGHD